MNALLWVLHFLIWGPKVVFGIGILRWWWYSRKLRLLQELYRNQEELLRHVISLARGSPEAAARHVRECLLLQGLRRDRADILEQEECVRRIVLSFEREYHEMPWPLVTRHTSELRELKNEREELERSIAYLNQVPDELLLDAYVEMLNEELQRTKKELKELAKTMKRPDEDFWG